MAAATTKSNAGIATDMFNAYTVLVFEVWWNGKLIAVCSTQADANTVAAAHPA